MALTPIFDPARAGRPMRVAGFMSGSGTNILRLLERQRALEEKGERIFEVVFIFSDRSDGRSRGETIAYKYGIPYFSYDIRRFHELRNIKRTVLTQDGLSAREEFDKVPALLVKAFKVDLIALGGYMSYTTLKRCVNVHPADLSILDEKGKRRYVGDRAVWDAISSGEKELRASTLWTDEGVDTGPLLMVSAPLQVKLPCDLDELKKNPLLLGKISDEHQERLKEIGDWQIFPETIEMIARGRFAMDDEGKVYVDGIPMPNGLRA